MVTFLLKTIFIIFNNIARAEKREKRIKKKRGKSREEEREEERVGEREKRGKKTREEREKEERQRKKLTIANHSWYCGFCIKCFGFCLIITSLCVSCCLNGS